MEVLVSKGFLVLAENSKAGNYVEQAYALALSIKHSQREVTSISIITNDAVPKKYQHVFDHIIPIPWYDATRVSKYKAENRWKFIHVSPYEETIVLDTDMLFLDDIGDWWNYLSNHDIKFCNRIKNYKLETIEQDLIHRRVFVENKLTNPYFACHYFKKSTKAFEFYKTLEFVSNNWEWCYNKFAPVYYQDWLSMDLAAAIAVEITGQYENVIDNVSPLEFVHMKTGIQGWDTATISWQDAVPFLLNSRGELVVGNIKQPKLFHYVEKSFLSKKILSRLEGIVNGKKETD
jgi:hypothetical protein